MSLNGIYRGKVLDNNDPLKRGRVKIEVYPYLVSKETVKQNNLVGFDGINTSVLPWATPAFGLFAGAGLNQGCFCVPDIDSFVFVFFENGDIYSPTYFAEAQTAAYGIPVETDEDYPYKKVWKTKNDIVISINDAISNRFVKIEHPAGTSILIDKDGNITIDSQKNINLIAEEVINVTAESDVNITSSADININSTGNVNINS